jgi:hypothetical protein
MPLTGSPFSVKYVVATIPRRSAVSPTACDERGPSVRIKLVKKLALVLDGIDLTSHFVGEEFACSYADGQVLVREGWAQPVTDDEDRRIDIEPPSESMMGMIDRLREGRKER